MVDLWDGEPLPVVFGDIDVWGTLLINLLKACYAWTETVQYSFPYRTPEVGLQECLLNSEYDWTLKKITLKTSDASTTIVLSPQIDNSNITGATNLTVTSTQSIVFPSANNIIAAGQDLNVNIASVTGSGRLIINFVGGRNALAAV